MASSITLYDDAGNPVVVDGEAMKYVPIDPDGVALTGQDLIDVGIIGTSPEAKIYPDGSIVGSSSNGHFTKWANGDLECYGVFTQGTSTDGTAHTLPVAHIDANFVVTGSKEGFYSASTNTFVSWHGWASGVDQVTVRVSAYANGTISVPSTGVTFNTIGRWK